MSNWNPQVEQIEGRLCEKGLMQERYDENVNDLVRTLTSEGRDTAQELLKNPEWRIEYLKLAKNYFAQFPLPIRKILWKKIANQLRDLKKEKREVQQESSNVSFVKE